ncbi:lantibiotic dehydratase [Yinghuangia sp. ASG 101]|uniref:lantibiotic dehydratase n=1 Tax=Yinghuangia sp. ASG 101 TaxID=2896848 RepID=UPI001E530B95|nr:lantibiotic dehydratase [Yinghuangia sp. ASG 101]UGQ10489.1 lantibiotic dehydratase [Yinghuangia sp. ASG 101]
MPRRVFTHQATAMARVPLRPYTEQDPPAAPGLLQEAVFLASRSADAQAAVNPPALRAYDIRSRCRSTPHGVFAGVGTATFGHGERLELGTEHRAVTLPSPRWLAAVAALLLAEAHVLDAVTFTTNNLAARHGDRWEAEHPHPVLREVGRSSVRATFVATWLMEACAHGVRGADLPGRFATAFPRAADAADRVPTAARQLAEQGLLLTDLVPDDPRDHPLTRLLSRAPAHWPHRDRVAALRALLADADTHSPGAPERLSLLRRAREHADAVVTVDRPLTADTLADLTTTLPNWVGRQAAQAADVLWRIGHLAEPAAPFHRRFLDRYGPFRMVPLLEAIDPAAGIGPPDENDAIGARNDLDARRARVLAALLAQSAGLTEVEVHEDLIAALDHGDRARVPRSAEIHVRVHREAGRLTVAVQPDGGSQAAGSAAGRFACWQPELRPAAPTAEAVVAEIVCRPLATSAAGLAVDSGSAPTRIALGVPPRPGDLTPDDLLLVSDGTRLTVRSRTLGRPVEPVLFSRLAPELLPTAARTLFLLGHGGERPWHTWSWGPAGNAPFTPRVRYRDITLAPARWRIPHPLVEHAARPVSWEKTLHMWRSDTRPALPDIVAVEEQDRLLPLDLRDETDRELLRRRVLKGARTVIEERGGPAVSGPDSDHVLDLVVLLDRSAAAPRREPTPRAAERSGAGLFLPGSEWLALHLPVPTHRQDDVLRELASLLREMHSGTGRHAFWLRYQTPAAGPHLRIRLHGAPEHLTNVLPRISAWCAQLHTARVAGPVTVHPYERETERYGGPGAITAAEEFFAADSTLVLDSLTLDADERTLAAAHHSAAIARHAPNPAKALNGGTLTRADRALRSALKTHLNGHQPPAADAWQDALAAYHAVVPAEFADACASDLIHMHCNRAFGPTREPVVRALARDLVRYVPPMAQDRTREDG